jgi:hypothetical protein
MFRVHEFVPSHPPFSQYVVLEVNELDELPKYTRILTGYAG